MAKSILLHCHPNPDPDSVGSALGLAHALRGVGKAVTVIQGDSDLDFAPGVFPGLETIVKKNWFELDLNNFDLFIALDVSNRQRVSAKGEVTFPPTMKTVVIDHHAGGEAFGRINLIEPSYPATAQILYDLFKVWQINLTHDAALCLLIGIYTDTGGFKYPGTTSATFSAVAELSSLAPDFAQAIFQMENNNPPGRVLFQGLALNAIETFCDNKVAIAAVSYEKLKTKGISESDTAHSPIANILKSVKGWEIGISLIENEPGLVRASFRARADKKYDLAQLAAKLGGGGHSAASGATIKAPLEEAKQLVLKALEEFIGDRTCFI